MILLFKISYFPHFQTLTFYFERKQRPSEVLNPDAVTPTTSAVIKRLPESATQSPTPIRAKPNISRAQIVSPDAAKNGKGKEVYEIKVKIKFKKSKKYSKFYKILKKI